MVRDGGSGSSLLWLWIVLAAVVVIGLIVWIARASGRRSAAAAGWHSRVINTYAKGQALADAENNVRAAIVILKRGVSLERARELLQAAGNRVSGALEL